MFMYRTEKSGALFFSGRKSRRTRKKSLIRLEYPGKTNWEAGRQEPRHRPGISQCKRGTSALPTPDDLVRYDI